MIDGEALMQHLATGVSFRARPVGLALPVGSALLLLLLCGVGGYGQRGGTALGDGPWVFDTAERGTRIRVSVVTSGLQNPWSLAFLPGGDMLVTERPGRLRIIRDGRLDPQPLAEFPQLDVDKLFDVALHPDFETNRLVYVSYIKRGEGPEEGYWATTAVARGRFDGRRLSDVEEIFVADAWEPLNGGDGSRIVFGPDGKLYVSSSHRRNPDAPQDPTRHVGKILRLNDDGTVPPDNPFVGRDGYRPEIFTTGHRTVLGLTFHPETGELWETENGPQGGDEVNILRAGRNYGWPVVTYGREYDGRRAAERPWAPGMEQPELFWVPSVTASGIAFYTGDRIPAWRGNLFLGAMTVGRIAGTGNLQRIVFNENGEQRRESLLVDLHQRIRDVRNGPDGLLYLLTDANPGALLVIEPAE
jgi:glucose/arabinose dehydrogenase